jgi:hypothetical protein
MTNETIGVSALNAFFRQQNTKSIHLRDDACPVPAFVNLQAFQARKAHKIGTQGAMHWQAPLVLLGPIILVWKILEAHIAPPEAGVVCATWGTTC